MEKKQVRCESVGVVFTDAGDDVEFRCSETYMADDDPKVETIRPKHTHHALIIFAREGQPYDLKWEDD